MIRCTHFVDVDDEIRAAAPLSFIKYDIFIKNRFTCELFILLNGEEWRKCAELILKKYEIKYGRRNQP